MTKKNRYSKDACIIAKTAKQIYVTIIPRVRVGYEVAIIIISNKREWNNCFVPTKCREFFPTVFVKTTDFSLFSILSRRVQLP